MFFKTNLFINNITAAFFLILPWIEGLEFFFPVSWVFFLRLLDRDNPVRGRFLWAYAVLVLWNAGVTWWIWNATPGGAVMAILANAALMCMVLYVFYFFSKNFSASFSLYTLIPFWMVFEYLHQYWDLSWTWLTLGNMLSGVKQVIAWYQYTGVSGGTSWILLANISIYYLWKNFNKRNAWIATMILLCPILFSFLLSFSEKHKVNNRTVKYMVVQPNIDPYNEKFYYDFETLYENTRRMILSNSSSEKFDLMIFPETFITYNLNEEKINHDLIIQQFRKDFIYSGTTKYILCGASTYCFYKENEKTPTSRLDKQSGLYYDMFNTALWISRDTVKTYHKSILVPGVEKMPFPELFGFLEKFAIDMGGTTGSLGVQKERTVFDSEEGWKVAPIVCYESVYGEYVGDYIRKGADFLCVITNDGWWGNTPGHRQHLRFGSLRCVEYAVPMLRSANTGISSVINSKGKITEFLPYQKSGVLKGSISFSSEKSLTFFAKYKDWLSRLSMISCLGIFAYSFYFSYLYKRKSEGKL